MYITTNLVLTTNIQTESSHVYPKTKLIKKDKPVPNLGIRKFVISKDCSLWTWLNENKKMVLLHIYKRPIMNTLSKKHLVLFNCNKTFTHTKSLWNTCKKNESLNYLLVGIVSNSTNIENSWNTYPVLRKHILRKGCSICVTKMVSTKT